MSVKMILSVGIAVIILGSIAAIVLNSNEKLNENNLRIAYFPNVGHVIPIVGIEKGFFLEKIDSDAVFYKANENIEKLSFHETISVWKEKLEKIGGNYLLWSNSPENPQHN